jgi:hypothetical protein
MLIDVAIPGHRTVIKKEAEKILKYKDLRIEIQRMRNVKASMIPVTIVANGTISKSLGQYLSNIPEKHEINKITKKKNPYWALAHIVRKMLMYKYTRISWGK